MKRLLSKNALILCILVTISIFFGFQNCSKKEVSFTANNETNAPSILEIADMEQPQVVIMPSLEPIDPVCESSTSDKPEIPYSEVGMVCSGSNACPSGFNCGPCTINDNCNADNYFSPYNPNGLIHFKFPLPTNSIQNTSNACNVGVEMNNIEGKVIEINSNQAEGSLERQLIIEIATYRAADKIKITAHNQLNEIIKLVETCRMRTSCYSGASIRDSRPPEDSIRTFTARLPAGTQKIIIDYSDTNSNTYVRILGLCDFNLEAFSTSGKMRLIP